MPRKLLATLALPLLLAAGCGSGGKDEVLTGDAALAALQEAPDAVAEAGSGHVEMTMDLTLEGESITMTVPGSFSGDRYEMSLDMGEIAKQVGEDVPPGMDEPMTIIVDGVDTYMRMPFLDPMLGGEGLWLTISLEDFGVAADSLGIGAGASDPTQLLETLRGTSGELEELGTKEIRGVEAAGFRAEVDLAKALEEMPSAAREVVKAQVGELDGTMPIEVWLDGDGLPRRMVMDMSDLFGTMGEDAAANVSMDFFDYGTDVDIEIPDTADTRSFKDVFGEMPGMEFEETGEAIG